MFLKMFTLQTWLHRGVIKLITLSVKKLNLEQVGQVEFFYSLAHSNDIDPLDMGKFILMYLSEVFA